MSEFRRSYAMRRAWALWAALGLGGFAVLESYALLNGRPYDSLSAVTRELLGLNPRSRRRWVTEPLFVVGLLYWVTWFIPHIHRVPEDQL